MSKISKEIINEFIKRGHFKSEQSVRNFISKIKTNEGLDCTAAAAAQVVAKIKNFSIARRLKKDDKVPKNISEIVVKYTQKSKKPSEVKNPKKKFNNKIRKSQTPIEKAAWENARIYPDIFILENKLRDLIFKQFGDDKTWWKKPFIIKRIQDYAQNIKKDEENTPWIPPRGEHPLYYITLKHLCKIMEINWSKFNKLGKLNKFLTRLEDLTIIRNCLAHNIPLKPRDKEEVRIQVPKLLSLIKNKYNI